MIDGEQLSDLEILSVIAALVTAGADTAVDPHTLALRALLLHPDQRRMPRERPELMEGAILEILRWMPMLGRPGWTRRSGLTRIGLNLVKVQGKLMIEEFERRFGDTAEIAGELEYDPMHFNARRINKMMIKTAVA